MIGPLLFLLIATLYLSVLAVAFYFGFKYIKRYSLNKRARLAEKARLKKIADDEYNKRLEEKYGGRIFGLHDLLAQYETKAGTDILQRTPRKPPK